MPEKGNAHAWLKGFNSYSLDAVGRVSARQFRSTPTFVRHFGKAPLQKDTWNTSKVTIMDSMFSGAKAFDQNISAWNTAADTYGLLSAFKTSP